MTILVNISDTIFDAIKFFCLLFFPSHAQLASFSLAFLSYPSLAPTQLGKLVLIATNTHTHQPTQKSSVASASLSQLNSQD